MPHEHRTMPRPRSNWLIIFVVIAFPVLIIGLDSREATSAALSSLVPKPQSRQPLTTPISTTANAKASQNMAVFWDIPPRSSATAFLNQQQIVMPGAEDQVRVIVELRDPSVAKYIRESFGAARQFNSAQAAAVQLYAGTLAARGRATIRRLFPFACRRSPCRGRSGRPRIWLRALADSAAATAPSLH